MIEIESDWRNGETMRQQKFRGNVFVANLPAGYTDEQLAMAFDPYGIVISAFLARDAKTGAVKNHGLVNIAPERAAGEAAAAMNGTEIGGKRIEARLADPSMALTIPNPRRAETTRSNDESHHRAYQAPARPRTFQVEHRVLGRRS